MFEFVFYSGSNPLSLCPPTKSEPKYGQPGLPTVGITSTQRVESTNRAVKPAMTRSATMVDVHRAISKKVKEDANKTTRWAAVNLWGVFRICCLLCVNIDVREKPY